MMKQTTLTTGWNFRRMGEEQWQQVELPHDAMILEERSDANLSGINGCWLTGADYEYEKTFTLPEDDQGKAVALEFEGVYHNAEIFLNGKRIGYRPYGYSDFFVEADGVKFGKENVLRVIAHNADQPNSRWYSGAGIYRPVHLLVAPKAHIAWNGVKIKTLSIAPAVVQVAVNTTACGAVECHIYDGETQVAAFEGTTDENGVLVKEVEIPNAKLWSPTTPHLYTAVVTFGEDERKEAFGVRTLTCDSKHGLCINGERVILRGACIHHDNGILGARCYPEAEERKIKLLLKAGYNAIRSAHNPCSKALLDACDRLGMLVMDEYVDEWYVHKTMYGYAKYVDEWWHTDLKEMVEKDFNHPSVVLYSTGNEVGETSEKRGIALTGDFTQYLHSLDDTRPVTCGINIWFNAMYHMGFGQYSDEKAKKAAEATSANDRKKQAVGSEFFNNLAGLVGADFMKVMATLPLCDKVTKDAYANMDVAGYNYGIRRYPHDLKKYPDRVILGSETFCSDAYLFWEEAQKHPALIGDFVWAGIDYLGELAVGSWEYKDYAPSFINGVGWMTAGSGRLDLNGRELGEALYTKVAFGLERNPQIAVVPVCYTDEKHSPSAWKFSNALPSWSWNGCDGKKAKVEVYARAHVVELFVNGKKVGKKKMKKNCRFDFTTTYYGGNVEAVAYDKQGKEIGRSRLTTASDTTVLAVQPEKTTAKTGEVCFVPLRFTDENGTLKPMCRGMIDVTVQGGKLLALGHACPYSAHGYNGTQTDTYYGEAMAVVQATGKEVIISATSGMLSGTGKIKVEE